MTRKTKHGKTIYMDRFVEWIIKDLRGGVGKFYRRGTDAKIDRQAMLLASKKEFKSVFDKEKGKQKKRKAKSTCKMGRVYCLTLKLFDELGVWKQRDATRLRLEPKLPKLNIQMIDLIALGENRTDTWISTNMMDLDEGAGDNANSDAQLLKKIQPTVEKREEDDKLDLERSTSTTLSFVEDK